MAWRGRCNRNKYWGLPTPALRINSIEDIERPDEFFRILLAQLDCPSDFFPRCSGTVKDIDGSTYIHGFHIDQVYFSN
jgi:hypothetical protein